VNDSRFLLQHDVDGEVLADGAEKVDQSFGHEPVGVVHEPGAVGGEIEEARHLGALPLEVGDERFGSEQRPLRTLPRRIADQPRAAAHQDDRPVPAALQVLQQHQWDEIAELQARRGGIEAAVDRDGPLALEVLLESRRRRVHQAAPLELRQNPRHGRES